MIKTIYLILLTAVLSISFAHAEVENPFGTQNTEKSTNKNTAKPVKKSSSNKSSSSSKTSCGSFPRTCGQMTSCSQARQALQCGNTKLDRDKDGIPCETICGG